MDARIWADTFHSELEEERVPGTWKLRVNEDLQIQDRGAQYTQRTFGRFRCSSCRRSLASAEIHVLFLMKLNKGRKQGTVKMRIFKQECKKCSVPMMEKPEISHENIERITSKLVCRIQQVFYGQRKNNHGLKPKVYIDDMEGPHAKEHCEACKLHVCRK